MVGEEKHIIELVKPKIHNIRGVNVILDRDLAEFYEVKPIRLREQVKRNIGRFPTDFMFQLNECEVEFMVSQNAIPSKKHLGGSLPYVFTEQGVANVSSVLTSKKAVEINIQIMRAFVELRNFVVENKDAFKRLNIIETKLLEHDNNFNEIFSLLEKDKPQKGIFFNGEFFDTHVFILDLIQKAEDEIILIDNYVDYKTLNLFKQKKKEVNIKIYTKNITKELKIDVKKFEKQYGDIDLIEFNKSHDRFLIIDKEVYHIGMSLKDIGKKWFAFSNLEEFYDKIVEGFEK